jgi:neutral trehalase
MNPSSKGTYMLSNLLQELALARDHNRKRIVLDEARLTENPVDRLSRMIKNSFWHSLTRRIDGDGLEIICADPKNRTGRIQPRIYVPHREPAMVEYYRKIASEKPHLNLDVQVLPPNPGDPNFVKSLNSKPGILALAMNEVDDGVGGELSRAFRSSYPELASTRSVYQFTWRAASLSNLFVSSSYTIGIPTSSPSDFSWMAKCRWPGVSSSISSLRSNTTTRS